MLQVSTRDTCFLFRLNYTGITPAIKRLLEDTTVPKIGLSWHDDLHGLQRLAHFTPGLFIDLQNLFGQKISKHERLTNWEADVLKEQQKRYAATDAWACIQLYEEYLRLKQHGNYQLVIVPEPPKPQPHEHEKSLSQEK